MSTLTALSNACIAIDTVASLPGTTAGQRLAALLQLQQHVDSLVNKATSAVGTAPARNTGD